MNTMKKLLFFCLTVLASCSQAALAQATIPRPDVCPACVQDTTDGYVSIADTMKHNPICNYELLTAAHLQLVHALKIDRAGIPFFPHAIDVLYKNSGDSRGHVIPFEDLAYSLRTAVGSMNLRRNLARQPQDENIGTKYACEQLCRKLAMQYGSVKVYGGTFGSLSDERGLNKPEFYWTMVVTPGQTLIYWMPTTGQSIGFNSLNDLGIGISYTVLVKKLGFDPQKVIK